MELILKNDVPNLGFKDDLVSVKNGYGRNYLIPQGLAILATTSSKKVLAENIKQREFKEKTFKQKIDLNLATQGQLEELNGIGKTFSKRILDYRNKLGGFTNDIQLYQVYGLDFQVANSILKEFTVKTPKEIIKMNLNSISASDISTIPSISFDIAKKIWEFRILNEGIKSFSELENIEGLTKRKLQGIQLYLKLE